MSAPFFADAESRVLNACLNPDPDLPDPVRKIITRRTIKVVGLMPSRKGSGMVPWESQIEQDFIYLCEIDRAVTAIAAQPHTFNLMVNGLPRKYSPDFLVRGRDGASWLVEVKPDKKAKEPEYVALFEAAAVECLRQNIGYVVAVESAIRRQPRLANAKLICRYKNIVPSVTLRCRVTETLEASPVKLADLVAASPETYAFQEIFALILDGTISIDLDQPLSLESLAWLSE